MKLTVKREQLRDQPAQFLRRAGYGYMGGGRGHEDSFVRRFSRNNYPRFHIYINIGGNDEVIFNLHLDQKKPSYQGAHAHNAEYDGPIVSSEITRLREMLGSAGERDEIFSPEDGVKPIRHDRATLPRINKAEKKGWFKRLFSN